MPHLSRLDERVYSLHAVKVRSFSLMSVAPVNHRVAVGRVFRV